MRTFNRFTLLCLLISSIFIPVQSSTATTGFSDLANTLSEKDKQAIQHFLPLEERAILRASNAGENDQFGTSMAISGDTLVIGAMNEDGATNAFQNSGAAYVFVRDQYGVWSQQAILRASDAASTDLFGRSVAIDGDTIVVGSSAKSGPSYETSAVGAAYVFVRNGTTWSQQAILKASDQAMHARFGWSLDIVGDMIAIGALKEAITNSYAGSIYVFTRSGSTWSQDAILYASNAESTDLLGSSVAISGNIIFSGAIKEAGPNNAYQYDSGAVYVFEWDGQSWSEQQILRASNAEKTDEFGSTLAVSGDMLIVGSQFEDGVNNSLSNAGAAYVFRQNETGTWVEQSILRASNTGINDRFAWSLDIEGDTISIGAYGRDENGVLNIGAAYVFRYDGTTWSEQDILYHSNPQEGDMLGYTTRIDGDTILVGSFADPATSNLQQSGAVHLFAPSQDPVAHAGEDQFVSFVDEVVLDGQASHNAAAYQWSQTSGTTVTLSTPLSATTSFTAPAEPSVLSFMLTITSTLGMTATDTVVITIENQAPVADAGPDQIVYRNQSVTLNGSDSSDPDGGSLHYHWQQIGGPSVVLSNPLSVTTSFTSPNSLDVLTFTLTVSDTAGMTATDEVVVSIENRSPYANIGPDKIADFSQDVILNSHASDPDGDDLSFYWEQTAGPAVSMVDRYNSMALINTTSITADLTFKVTVQDGWDATTTDEIVIKVRSRIPAADAGPDQVVDLAQVVTLDGSGSIDPRNDSLTYHWTQTGGPTVALSNSTAIMPSFMAPDTSTILTFTLNVTNTDQYTHSDEVVIIVDDLFVGADQEVTRGQTITLTSQTLNPDIQAYHWQQTGGPTVSLSHPFSATTTFMAPNEPVMLHFTLTITHTAGLTDTDEVVVTVENQAPVINVDDEQTVAASEFVTLAVNATDPENDALTYQWIQTSGISVTLSDPTSSNPTFIAPAEATTLVFELSVTDNFGATTTATVTINVEAASYRFFLPFMRR